MKKGRRIERLTQRVKFPLIIGKVRRAGEDIESILSRIPVKQKHRLVMKNLLQRLLARDRNERVHTIITEHLRFIPREEQEEFLGALNSATRELYSKFDLDTERAISVPVPIEDEEFKTVVKSRLNRLETLLKQQSGDLQYYIKHIDIRNEDEKLQELVDFIRELSGLGFSGKSERDAKYFQDLITRLAKARLENEYVGLLYNRYKAARTVLQEIIEEGKKRGYNISFEDLVEDLKDELRRQGIHPVVLKYFHLMRG